MIKDDEISIWTYGPHNLIADPIYFLRRHCGVARTRLFIFVSGEYCKHDNFQLGLRCNDTVPVLSGWNANWLKFPFKSFPWIFRDSIWQNYMYGNCQERACRDFHRAKVLMCVFPARMCELLLPFGKPLLVLPLGLTFDWGAVGSAWHEVLAKLVETSRQGPPVVVASPDRFTTAYLKHYMPEVTIFLGLEPLASHAIPVKYQPGPGRRILLGPPGLKRQNQYLNIIGQLAWLGRTQRFSKRFEFAIGGSSMQAPYQLIFPGEDGGYSSLDELGTYTAMVALPYAPFSYTFAEIYSVGVPMIFPSSKLLTSWQLKHRVLTEWVHPVNETISHRATRSPRQIYTRDIVEWIKLAWYYEQPHILYFDNLPQLLVMLDETQPKTWTELSRQMKATIRNKIPVVRQRWEMVLALLGAWSPAGITTDRSSPVHVETQMTRVYGHQLGGEIQKLLDDAHQRWSLPVDPLCRLKLKMTFPKPERQRQFLGVCCDPAYGAKGHVLCFGNFVGAILSGSNKSVCCSSGVARAEDRRL